MGGVLGRIRGRRRLSFARCEDESVLVASSSFCPRRSALDGEGKYAFSRRSRAATEVNVVVVPPTKGNAYGPVRSLLVMGNTETLASDRWQRERCSKGKAQPLRCCCRNRTASREKNDELSAREIPYLGTMISSSSSSPLEDK